MNRTRYLLHIVLSVTFDLKDYDKLTGNVTFTELKDIALKLESSDNLRFKLIGQNRLHELKDIYSPDKYPEKWI